MRCYRLYCVSLSMLALAMVLNLFLVSIRPPKVATYAEFLPNGKIVMDKKFLEGMLDQYPPVLAKLSTWIGNDDFARWLLPLTEDSLAAAARSRAGLGPDAQFWLDKEAKERLLGPPGELSSYANTYWYSHFKILLKALEEEAHPYLGVFGRLAIRDTIIQGLAVQLKLVDLFAKHPEIAKEQIKKPIIITGPQRTMTTHAQSILAQHPDVHYVRIAEMVDPFAPEGIDPKLIYTEADPRAWKNEVAMVVLKYVRPFFQYMFRFETDRPASTPMEDVLPMSLSFGSPTFEVNTYIPSYQKEWHSRDNKSSYRFLKIYQQFIQWQRRKILGISKDDPKEKRKQWIMKTPEHLSFLKDMISVYPDAKIIMTHRDPVSAAQSFIPLIVYMMGFWNYRFDASHFGEYSLVSMESRYENFLKHYDSVPKEQFLHVPFKEFVVDNLASIKKMCAFAGLALDDEAVRLMDDYIKRSPREGANRIEYRIETLGANFTEQKLRERFAAYSTKFAEYM